MAMPPEENKAVIQRFWEEVALHQKSGADTRGSSSNLNKPPLLVVACNFGARPSQAFTICRVAR